MNRQAIPGMVLLGAVLLGAPAAGVAKAAGSQTQPQTLPRFASLSSDKVFMREGPTYDHPVLWVYRRKGLPVEILAQFDVWRRVRDSDGTVGWIHSSMLSDRRTAIVTGTRPVPLRARPARDADITAFAQPGVIAILQACNRTACEISTNGIDGWIDRTSIWGVRAGDVFN